MQSAKVALWAANYIEICIACECKTMRLLQYLSSFRMQCFSVEKEVCGGIYFVRSSLRIINSPL